MQPLITPFELHKNSNGTTKGLYEEHLHPTISLVQKIQLVPKTEGRWQLLGFILSFNITYL